MVFSGGSMDPNLMEHSAPLSDNFEGQWNNSPIVSAQGLSSPRSLKVVSRVWRVCDESEPFRYLSRADEFGLI
jgi:hypothetical protein